MKVNKSVATLLLASGLVIGGLGGGILMAPSSNAAHAAPVSQTQPVNAEDDQVQDPSYVGSVPVDPAATDGLSEADEAASLQPGAKITAAAAEAAALAANPGATVVKTKMDNENGYLVYSVELDNGTDVKVDAGNSAVLAAGQGENGSEEADAGDTDDIQDEQEDGDQDDVQEEHDGQPDDATEEPGVEDAIGQ